MGLNVLIVGGGGREHALAWKIAQSSQLGKLFIAPGNAGTGELGENVPLRPDDINGLADFAERNAVDLTVVGPEGPLAANIGGWFRYRGLPVFGPSQGGAMLESSKAMAKQFMDTAGVPTARYVIVRGYLEAKAAVAHFGLPLVVKASGLASGKGVFVCETEEEAARAVDIIIRDRALGAAGDEVVIEEKLGGREVSVHALTDGLRYELLPPSQDHKTLYEGGRGPNTGGMGVIAPVPWFAGAENEAAVRQIVERTLNHARYTGRQFTGCLYPGLMVTVDGPKVLEYNARFGDPETQVYMRLLKSDFLQVADDCASGRLGKRPIEWRDGFAVCVVLASPGYPARPAVGRRIIGVERAGTQPGVAVFHSGTALDAGGELVSAGGRVLSVTAVGDTVEEAIHRAYHAICFIHFDGMQFRRDIGKYCR
jgi:phosphoribosylamine--glycine ligase